MLNTAAGAIPFVGGILAAGAGAWSEREQSRINDFLKHLADMLAAEMKEKTQTIMELTARIDMHDEEIAKRIRSAEYQSLLRKAFRDWAGTESEEKRTFVRNLLSNAAASTLASDDVAKLFLQWIRDYSELHFATVGAVYNSAGITRAGVWEKLGRKPVREDSSDADLFRLIFRDLSTGGLVRQHRETDWQGNFLAKPTRKGPPLPKSTQRTMKSAFDDGEQYELTALGEQFVHYAMTDIPPKIEFKERELRPQKGRHVRGEADGKAGECGCVGKNVPSARTPGPGDEMPPEYWQAVLDDPGADAGRRTTGPSIRTQRLSDIQRHLLRVTFYALVEQ